MKKILFLILLLVPIICKSQLGAVVDLKIKNPSDSILMIIWRLDWENKIIYDRPRTIEIKDSTTSVSLRMGDWAIEYRIGDRIYSIMNLHIYGNSDYYRYMIYYGYHNGDFREVIIDEIDTKIVYGDF